MISLTLENISARRPENEPTHIAKHDVIWSTAKSHRVFLSKMVPPSLTGNPTLVHSLSISNLEPTPRVAEEDEDPVLSEPSRLPLRAAEPRTAPKL